MILQTMRIRSMKRSYLLLAALLAGCTTPPPASSLAENAGSEKPAETPKDCSDPSIKEIDMPVDHGNPAAGTFRYKYQHVIRDKDAETIVTLPDGMGGGTIGTK